MSTLDQDWDAVTAADVQAAEEENLIPTGTYEGVVLSYKPQLVESEKAGVLFGKRVARVTAELYEVAGRTRQYFFDAAPGILKDDGKPHMVSRIAAQLAKHTGTVGLPFNETLDAAMMTRLRYRIRRTDADEARGYAARNWLDAVTAVR